VNRSYAVYVIEAVEPCGDVVLYVGHTAKSPAARLREHMNGKRFCPGCTKRHYVKGHKHTMHLASRFMPRGRVATRAEAEALEKATARALRKIGYKVRGGH